MSENKIKAPVNDRRPETALQSFLMAAKESGEDTRYDVAARPFFAGWNARFNAAVAHLSRTLDDGAADHQVILDHIKSQDEALSRTHKEYFRYYQECHRLTQLVRDLRLAAKTRYQDDGSVPAWKRISMQRKELRALLVYGAERERALLAKNDRIAELEAKLKEKDNA